MPVVTYCVGLTVTVVVARGVQLGLAAAPGCPPFGAVVVAGLLGRAVPEVGLPLPAGAPPPVLLAPPGDCPPVSTVELTCSIASLNGGTASVTLATKARPASTPTCRSHAPVERLGLVALCRAGARVAVSSRNRGRGSALGLGRDSSHAQCPSQTQCLAWSKAPAAMLTSQGCGWRPLVRARIRSSPSAPGSTWLTAAHSVRRNSFSRPSSDTVIPSPSLPAPSLTLLLQD